MLWQAGDRHYSAHRYAPAAAFFQLGSHRCLASLGTANTAKCFRKAAVCYLQMKEYARAAQVVRRGDEHCRQAGTCFVLFLVAAEQGLEDEGALLPDYRRHREVTFIVPCLHSIQSYR